MNIDILRCTLCNNYNELKELTKDKEDNLSRFYYHFACYFLNEDKRLLVFLDETNFSKDEICEVYDFLDTKYDKLITIAKEKLKEKYKNYLKLDNVYKDEEVISIASAINLPKKEYKKVNISFYLGIGLVIIGLVHLLISILVSFKLNEEIIYFCTVILLAVPSGLITLGVNLIVFKKQNWVLMILEAFILVYLLSFLCLISYQDNISLLVNLKNHFYKTLTSLYDFFAYYTFKALEGLE